MTHIQERLQQSEFQKRINAFLDAMNEAGRSDYWIAGQLWPSLDKTRWSSTTKMSNRRRNKTAWSLQDLEAVCQLFSVSAGDVLDKVHT